MKIMTQRKILIPLLVTGLLQGCIVRPHPDPYYDQGFIGGARPQPAYESSGGYYEDPYYSRPRRRVRSAARGAAGDAGKGAAIGAATGAIFGGRRRHRRYY
jgi:hypothetical protein